MSGLPCFAFGIPCLFVVKNRVRGTKTLKSAEPGMTSALIGSKHVRINCNLSAPGRYKRCGGD
jgi:hypothetical protein